VRSSLRFRLALTHAAVALVAIVVVGVTANLAVSRRFDQYVAAQQRSRDRAVVEQLAQTYMPGAGWDSQAIFSAQHLAMMNGVGLRVYDPSGKLLFAVGRGSGMMGQGGQGGMMGQGGMTGQGSGARDGGVTVDRHPVVVGGATVAQAEVAHLAGSVLPEDAAYRRSLNLYLVLAAVIAGALALAVSVVVSRRIARPVVALTGAAARLERGDLGVRVPAEGGDEVAGLAHAFNSMAQALSRQEEWRRTMTADLAHELRTPLATIQARIEAIEDGVLPATPENLRVIGEEVERLARLLGELRSLNEVEAEGFALRREPLDLAEVARDAATSAEASFVRKGVALTVEAQAVAIDGDRDRLRQVVANLLDNALKFTPAGGHVELSVTPERTTSGGRAAPAGSAIEPGRDGSSGRYAVLRVGDDGPGIAAGDLPYVFERFYRADDAKGTRGAGLGLAIVKRLVDAHGGTVEAGPGASGGAVFTVRLPTAPPPAPGRGVPPAKEPEERTAR
jgi:signal transduction histidine kinase